MIQTSHLPPLGEHQPRKVLQKSWEPLGFLQRNHKQPKVKHRTQHNIQQFASWSLETIKRLFWFGFVTIQPMQTESQGMKFGTITSRDRNPQRSTPTSYIQLKQLNQLYTNSTTQCQQIIYYCTSVVYTGTSRYGCTYGEVHRSTRNPSHTSQSKAVSQYFQFKIVWYQAISF